MSKVSEERPIIFSPVSIPALLDGTKTETRRIIKHQPPNDPREMPRFPYYWGEMGTYSGISEPRHYWTNRPDESEDFDDDTLFWPSDADEDDWYTGDVYGSGGYTSPYGSEQNCMKPAARLWVRESFQVEGWGHCGGASLRYPADESRREVDIPYEGDVWTRTRQRWLERAEARGGVIDETSSMVMPEGKALLPVTSPRYMPRWASRVLLEISSVRVQRLQDISERDAVAEGMLSVPQDPAYLAEVARVQTLNEALIASGQRRNLTALPVALSPRQRYARVWDDLNGPGSFEANPWVWVIAFRRVEE